MNISDLAEERAGYANGHAVGRDPMRFLVRRQSPQGVTTHSLQPEAFDGLDPTSKAKGWAHKVGALHTKCGLGGIDVADLLPAYALPMCLECRGRETTSR